MSSPDASLAHRLGAIAAELRALAGSGAAVPEDGLRDLMGAATLLYSASARHLGREVSLADPSVSPTDAVVLCCAALRGQGLNPFDLTLWFGRVAPDPAREP